MKQKTELTEKDLASTRHEVSSRAIAEGLNQREKPGMITEAHRDAE